MSNHPFLTRPAHSFWFCRAQRGSWQIFEEAQKLRSTDKLPQGAALSPSSLVQAPASREERRFFRRSRAGQGPRAGRWRCRLVQAARVLAVGATEAGGEGHAP